MDKTSGLQLMALSRRTIVARSVAAAAGVAVLFGLVTKAAAKMSQKSVDYQDTPKNDQEWAALGDDDIDASPSQIHGQRQSHRPTAYGQHPGPHTAKSPRGGARQLS